MSAEIRSWVRSILCCLCLMQLAEQILPDNHYQKYIRLFCGVLFLILLISPLTDQAHLTAVFGSAAKRGGAGADFSKTLGNLSDQQR